MSHFHKTGWRHDRGVAKPSIIGSHADHQTALRCTHGAPDPCQIPQSPDLDPSAIRSQTLSIKYSLYPGVVEGRHAPPFSHQIQTLSQQIPNPQPSDPKPSAPNHDTLKWLKDSPLRPSVSADTAIISAATGPTSCCSAEESSGLCMSDLMGPYGWFG